MTLLSTLTDPDSFFQQRSSDLSLVSAAGVVLVVAALSSLNGILLVHKTLTLAGASGGSMLSYVFGGLPALLGVLIVWAVLAAAFHFLATILYEGEASFKETLAITGWGYLPQALTSAISVGLIYYLLFVEGTASPAIDSLQATQQYMRSVQSQTLFRVAKVVGIGGTLWSGYLWISGVATVQDIDESDAFVVVGIPVALLVVLSLWSLL